MKQKFILLVLTSLALLGPARAELSEYQKETAEALGTKIAAFLSDPDVAAFTSAQERQQAITADLMRGALNCGATSDSDLREFGIIAGRVAGTQILLSQGGAR